MFQSLPIEKIENTMKLIQQYLENVDKNLTPMHISFGVFEIIRKETGIHDVLEEKKDEANKSALLLNDYVAKIIKESNDSLYVSIKTAIAGNIIDYGVSDNYNLSKTVNEVLQKEPVINNYRFLKQKLSKSKKMTILADNAGEIIFDLLMIKEINRLYQINKIDLIVKKYPFSNDICKDDINNINFEGIDNLTVLAIDNRLNVDYIQDVKNIIKDSDIIICKGQGNFELLYDEDLKLFFLFIVKCKTVSNILSVEKGEIVISYK